MVDEAVLVLGGRGAFDEETYVPLLHEVVPFLLEAYRLGRPTYDEALVLRDRQQHLSERRAEVLFNICISIPCLVLSNSLF